MCGGMDADGGARICEGTTIKKATKTTKDDMVTISRKEYVGLSDSQRMLEALQGVGVDNWQGYDMAMGFYETGEIKY